MPYTIPSYTVSPGSFYQPKGAGLILDQITGAIAAWSTRRLISTAPADIARGRDASTNELDFTAAELAGSGFTDLAGAGDGFYVTLYDQIGSNNATQATAASQPKGVDTGALITDGAVPVLELDGSDDALIVPDSATFDVFNNFSITVKYKFSAGAFYQTLISKYNGSGPVLQWGVRINNNAQVSFIYSQNGTTIIEVQDFTNPAIVDTWHVSTITFASGVIQFYIDSTKSVAFDKSASGTSVYDGGVDIAIGSRLFGSVISSPLLGGVSDAIIFNRVLTDTEVTQLHTALS